MIASSGISTPGPDWINTPRTLGNLSSSTVLPRHRFVEPPPPPRDERYPWHRPSLGVSNTLMHYGDGARFDDDNLSRVISGAALKPFDNGEQ